ncbi:MAG: radical SAM protein [Chloroflexi bacterium]|nr:radical SAM protein [Chloroflexota bacterium]MBU1750082.1 radical SAM protein [Chloroflexota bacterium]
MSSTDTITFDLDQPLHLPALLSWRQVEEAYLCLAPAQPNWIVTDLPGAALLTALGWGETPRAALRLAGQITGKPPGTLLDTLTTLLAQIERQRFYANAPVTELDPATAKRMLHVYLTNRCNLHCPQCYMDAGTQAGEELTTAKWLDVLDQFTAIYGPSVVALSGGEPLLRPDLGDLAAHAHAQGHQLSLFTNGTLIADAAMARRLGELFDWVQISLDGANPAVHDAVRGAGTFQRAVQAIRLLGDTDVHLRIGVTVLPQNAADLTAHLADLLESLGGTRLAVAVNSAWPEGRARTGHLCPDLGAMDDAVAGVLAQLQTRGWPGDPPRQPRRPRRSCGYGGGVIVAASGDVHACQVLTQPLGNVRATPLVNLAAQLNRIYQEASVDHMAECAACDLRLICGGGCRVRNWRETGDPCRPICTEASRQALYWQLVAARSTVA